jgi:hypothetical protein
METKTGLCRLEENGTNEDMIYNNLAEEEIEESCELREEILAHVDMGIIPTIANINGAYITSKKNAVKYTEMYGWLFSDINITEL